MTKKSKDKGICVIPLSLMHPSPFVAIQKVKSSQLMRLLDVEFYFKHLSKKKKNAFWVLYIILQLSNFTIPKNKKKQKHLQKKKKKLKYTKWFLIFVTQKKLNDKFISLNVISILILISPFHHH